MKNLKVEWCLYILNAYFEDCFDWLSKGEEREREDMAKCRLQWLYWIEKKLSMKIFE